MKVPRKIYGLCNFTLVILTSFPFCHIGEATKFLDTNSPIETKNFNDRTYRPILHSKDDKNRNDGSLSTNVNRVSDASPSDDEKDTRGCPACPNGGCNLNQTSNSIPVGQIIGAVIIGIIWIIVGIAIYFAFIDSYEGKGQEGYGYGYNRRNERLPPVPDFNQIDYSYKNSDLKRYQYQQRY